jgi:glycosyltransferase involved in cell wall biosynthesis
LVKQSIQSVLDQDYSNVELILVNNGAEFEVQEYLSEVYYNSKNVSLIQFEENQFSWDDVEKSVAVCWNAALIHAKGDYVSHLSYDDMLAPSYARLMVDLFEGDPNCCTAAPMPCSINSEGVLSTDLRLKEMNSRGRYTNGFTLALDFIEGSPQKLIAAPGEIFVIRRDLLLKYGGYDRNNDIFQILKYGVMGSSGFDPSASLYWRHHDNQLNRQAKRKGCIWYSSQKKAWDKSGIVKLWQQRFDPRSVKKLLDFKKSSLKKTPLTVVAENVKCLNFVGCANAFWNITKECPALFPLALYSALREMFSMLFHTLRRF